MLGLTLRKEFQGKVLKGTMIEIGSKNQKSALRQSSSEFLGITYPSHDIVKAVECISPNRNKPVVIMGDRGQGKSHLLAALYHVVGDPEEARSWLSFWSRKLKQPEIESISVRNGMHVISEGLHEAEYKSLWELLFERHPEGQRFKGKWEEKGGGVPSKSLMTEMFQERPTLLILDELQTWYGSLTDTKQRPLKSWAFHFLQILSEIAADRGDIFVMIASVLDGNNEAYQQIHRVGEQLVDFKGSDAAHDRRRLLLHRLFENRMNVPEQQIRDEIGVHVAHVLKAEQVSETDRDRVWEDYIECWPFSPRLLMLLEDQVLIATELQETRDLIKLLAALFKCSLPSNPIITPGDIELDGKNVEFVQALSAASETRLRDLREKALRNLQAVQDAESDWKTKLPHLRQVVGALWLRSITTGNNAGADVETLQIDLTKREQINENAFLSEIIKIRESSFNIHKVGDLFVFKREENAETKLLSLARNNRLFEDGSDLTRLSLEIEYVIGGSEEAAASHVVVALPREWNIRPWNLVAENKRPDNWPADKLPMIVVPEDVNDINQSLGSWLSTCVSKGRNTFRFILPKKGTRNIYDDRELIVDVRAMIKAEEWKKEQRL